MTDTLWIPQKYACKSRIVGTPFNRLPKCVGCLRGSSPAGKTCRFIGFRMCDAGGEKISFCAAHSAKEPRFSRVYNRKPTGFAVESTKRACAIALLPFLEREQAHCVAPDAVYCPREDNCRPVCDICCSELFTETWLCITCGWEMCQRCVADVGTGKLGAYRVCQSATTQIHAPPHLKPSTRFTRSVLVSTIHAMREFVSTSGTGCERTVCENVPQICDDNTFRVHDFLDLWNCGGPIVVTGVQKRLQGGWTPNDFISAFNTDQKVTVIDYTDSVEAHHRQTVGEFFGHLSTPNVGGRALKLKDWPPRKNFKDAFPDLYDAFCTSIPAPDLACPNGILNLASHFPKNCVPPDLGPKMYIAVAAPPDRGTTNLHMDVTDACNLMVWSARPDGPSAVWDIFRAQDASTVRQFMREEYGLTTLQDPIHVQTFYLPDEALARLQEKYEVCPWRIYQRVGDVIYIPAGCAHQVRNIENVIKIACDFVSAANLNATERLVSELRARRLSERGDDVLQLYTMLWYAWCSVSTEMVLIQDDPPPTIDNTCENLVAAVPLSRLKDAKLTGPDDEDTAAGMSVHDGSQNIGLQLQSDDPLPKSSYSIRGAEAANRLDLRRLRRTSQRAAKAYARRPPNPAHTYPCPHPQCEGIFNRGGLLDHMKIWHCDIYGVTADLEKKLRKEGKCSVEEFWRILHSTHKKPPSEGQLMLG